MFAWSHTWYAKKHGMYFNFDSKKQRDLCCEYYDFVYVTASEAYKHYSEVIRVECHQFKHFLDCYKRLFNI